MESRLGAQQCLQNDHSTIWPNPAPLTLQTGWHSTPTYQLRNKNQNTNKIRRTTHLSPSMTMSKHVAGSNQEVPSITFMTTYSLSLKEAEGKRKFGDPRANRGTCKWYRSPQEIMGYTKNRAKTYVGRTAKNLQRWIHSERLRRWGGNSFNGAPSDPHMTY